MSARTTCGGLLVYGYCPGVMSSRKIEWKTHEDVVVFRYLAGGRHPEFSTICTFRRTHLGPVPPRRTYPAS